MELYDIFALVYTVITYVFFGGICVYIGYKKGEEKGRLKGASYVCDEVRRIIGRPDPLVRTVAWIPTEERLPAKASRYLVHIKDFVYATDLYYDEGDGFYDEYDDGERVYYSVVHWAEFPELPGKEEAADETDGCVPKMLDEHGEEMPDISDVPLIGSTIYSVLPNDVYDDDGGYHIEPWAIWGSGITKDGEIYVLTHDKEIFMLDDEEEGLSFSTREKAERYLKGLEKK